MKKKSRILLFAIAVLPLLFAHGLLKAEHFSELMPASDDLGIVIEDLQQIVVSGTVTDENDLPMPEVHVVEKGTINAVATDANGVYKIRIINPEAILQFSFIGYKTKEVSVSGQTVINLRMEPDVSVLEDVVIVGYGVQKKSHHVRFGFRCERQRDCSVSGTEHK